MGRIAFALFALVLGFTFLNKGLPFPDDLSDKMWLVALFPAVYVLGYALLAD
ncbi:MAG: hypothetical protein JSS20_10830 [Proteobacteria bacterium]|nr:hypothetical protein [Pseudomonadota bacterium]